MNIDDDRLAVVEAEIARLRNERIRDEDAKARVYDRTPEPTGYAADNLRIQEAERRARRAAHSEQNLRYERQLAASAPQRQRLQAQLAEVQVRVAEENDRHAKALGEITGETAAVQKKLDELSALPEMPEVDYSEPIELRRQARDDQMIVGLGAEQPPPRNRPGSETRHRARVL